MTPTRAWGGLVPHDSVGPHDDVEQVAAAEGVPTGTPRPDPPSTELEAAIHNLIAADELRGHPAQMHPVFFNGAGKEYTRRSSHPPKALSVGFVNPLAIKLYVGLDGGRAQPNSNAFVIPPTSAMVVPVAVDAFDMGVDPAELLESSGTIFLLRFAVVQPFYAAKLA